MEVGIGGGHRKGRQSGSPGAASVSGTAPTVDGGMDELRPQLPLRLRLREEG